MNELLEASLRFPTVIFTIGLGVALVYWVFVLLGALDIDLFGHADASGAAKGLKLGGDAHDGGVDGHDGGLWEVLGVSGIPITISFSVIVLVGWIMSLLGMEHVGSAVGNLGGWLPALMLMAVLILAVVVGGRLVSPLRVLFQANAGKTNRDYIGHTCTITTGRVDDDFGQATVEDGGTVLVIPVRCDRAGALSRGQKALIIDFDGAREAYLVEPSTDLMARTGEE